MTRSGQVFVFTGLVPKAEVWDRLQLFFKKGFTNPCLGYSI
jgi:hypothetical protein